MHLFDALFPDDPPVDGLQDLKDVFEALAKVEAHAANKLPLAQALKDLGIEGGDLDETPGGLVLNIDDDDTYRVIADQLGRVEMVNQLADLGWVAFLGGDANNQNQTPRWQVKFLELDEHDAPSDDTGSTDLDQAIKTSLDSQLPDSETP